MNRNRRRVRWFCSAIVVFFCACGGAADDASSQKNFVLLLPTVDGLNVGDPVRHGDDKVGEVISLDPVVNQVEAKIEFKKSFRPSLSARFRLLRLESGERAIEVIDPGPSGARLKPGETPQVELPPETIENQLWVAR